MAAVESLSTNLQLVMKRSSCKRSGQWQRTKGKKKLLLQQAIELVTLTFHQNGRPLNNGA